MRFVILLALVVFVACSHSAGPASPTTPPMNLACQQARTIDKNAACLPLRTGVAGVPDLALADVGTGILVRCTAGEGMGAGCAAFADLRPKAPEPKAEAPTAATAASSPAPVSTPAKPDAKKPEPKK